MAELLKEKRSLSARSEDGNYKHRKSEVTERPQNTEVTERPQNIELTERPQNIELKRSKYGNWQSQTYFRKPYEIGFFSHDLDRKYHYNSRQSFKVLQMPGHTNVHFDLRQGFHTFIEKNVVADKLDNLLQFLMNERKSLSHLTDFVCWRGLITNIMCTFYEIYDGWLIGVTKFNGTHYMCQFEPEEKKIKKANETTRQKEMSYWGFKFEQYLTSDKPDERPNTKVPVNCKEDFCSVVRTRLSNHSLVYGGEVDCYMETSRKQGSRRHGRYDATSTGGSDDPREGMQYVELKTNRLFSHRRQEDNFHRSKSAKWWAQSFLLNVPDILCGFRDDNGTVKQLKWFSTHQLPSLAQQAWRPETCLAFVDHVLTSIKQLNLPDDPHKVCLLEWKFHADDITVTPSESPEFMFLPDWFINHVTKMKAN